MTLTAYQLRRHLAQAHDIHLAGADWQRLVTVHDLEHRATNPGHTHDGEGVS